MFGYEYRERISDSKQKHMFAVAEHMGKYADQYGLDPDKMYILGLLHDIGYIYGAEGHEKNGAKLLASYGFDDKITYAVEHHGDSLKRMQKRKKEITPELVFLISADMKYGQDGINLGFDKRLKELQERYDDITVAKDNVEFVIKYYDDFFNGEGKT